MFIISDCLLRLTANPDNIKQGVPMRCLTPILRLVEYMNGLFGDEL